MTEIDDAEVAELARQVGALRQRLELAERERDEARRQVKRLCVLLRELAEAGWEGSDSRFYPAYEAAMALFEELADAS